MADSSYHRPPPLFNDGSSSLTCGFFYSFSGSNAVYFKLQCGFKGFVVLHSVIFVQRAICLLGQTPNIGHSVTDNINRMPVAHREI